MMCPTVPASSVC